MQLYKVARKVIGRAGGFRLSLLVIALALISITAFTACSSTSIKPSDFKGSPVDPPFPAQDFTLVDRNGQNFRLSDQRGHVVLLFFGYTRCPDACPLTISAWAQAYNTLGETAQDVRWVMVTVDPGYDTLQVLGEFLIHYNQQFIGLTGSLEDLHPVYKAYGVVRLPLGPEYDDAVAHTDRSFLIDPQGNIRATLLSIQNPQDIAHDILLLQKAK